MSTVPFSWMWGDPAATLDRLREIRASVAEEEARLRVADRQRKARRIRKLTKLAMAGNRKGKA